MEVEIGRVTHYYNHLNVAVLQLNAGLKVGYKIHILGYSTDFTEKVTSMEVNHHSVIMVEAGADVAIKVTEPVREHDIVYRVFEESREMQPA
jgi:hypothetical protein